jgi:hypothetical protein
MRLSWKKILAFLSWITSTILLQYDRRWVFEHSSLVYLMKSSTLNSFDTIMLEPNKLQLRVQGQLDFNCSQSLFYSRPLIIVYKTNKSIIKWSFSC